MARPAVSQRKPPAKPKLELADVTICAADCTTVALAAQALERSIDQCNFGDAVLFSDQAISGRFRRVAIPRLSTLDAYSGFITHDLASEIHTDFVLVVQWDGYVVGPEAWSAGFRDYDYIGATWPWHTDRMMVGNGGFSFRSRKLLDVIRNTLPRPSGENEDDFICRRHRLFLEREHGIRFAPVAVANRFSYEHARVEQPTFGFHGLFNLWRHLSMPDMVAAVGLMAPGTLRTTDYVEVMLAQIGLQRTRVARAMYVRLREHADAAACRALLLEISGNPEQASMLLEQLDRLIARRS